MGGPGVPQSDKNSRWPAAIGFSLLGFMVLGLISLAWWSFSPQRAIVIPPAPVADDKARQRALTLIPTTQSMLASASQVPNPVTIAPSAAGSVIVPGVNVGDVLPPGIAAPVSLSGSSLTIAPQGSGDPLQFALHPSHFADPNKLVQSIGAATIAPVDLGPVNIPGPVVLSADAASSEASTSSAPAAQQPIPAAKPIAAAKPVDHYAEAVRLENARKFVMSMCTDLQGRIWIASEGTQPNDGTGGVQCFDPSKPPLEAFTQYTTKDGLGDNFCYAIACDLQGRIWVGHLNHGVSIFNGQKWQNYDVIGGLSHPNTLSGPLGERIFHITVCPATAAGTFKDPITDVASAIAGSVWMCTNAGISIYFTSTDTWSYITQLDGLPSDAANSIAFDPDGNVYVANQCDGISMADATDGYAHWRSVTGPDDLPATPSGSGLPGNMMNDIAVLRDSTVWATSTAGITWSKDQGKTWKYESGNDWLAKFKARATAQETVPEALPLAASEDYSTCVAEVQPARVFIGHWRSGCDVFLPGPMKIDESAVATGFVSAVEHYGDGVFFGTYGQGLVSQQAGIVRSGDTRPDVESPSLPRMAATLTLGSLDRLADRVRSAGMATTDHLSPICATLDDDWRTQGDWLGRYGRYWICLCSWLSPHDYFWGAGESGIPCRPHLVGTGSDSDGIRHWLASVGDNDPRNLELPAVYLQSLLAEREHIPPRREGEWDDHSEGFQPTAQRPSLACDVYVPQGSFYFSLYEVNENGHGDLQSHRDYRISIRAAAVTGRGDARAGSADNLSEVAHSRVTDFWGGVYKRFAIRGPAIVRVSVERGVSLNTTMTALALDRVGARTSPFFRQPEELQLSPSSAIPMALGLAPIDQIPQSESKAGKFYVEAMRYAWVASRDQSKGADRDSFVVLERSCFDACQFDLGERAQATQGLTSARQIEKSLLWDPNIANYSGRERAVISQFSTINSIHSKDVAP